MPRQLQKLIKHGSCTVVTITRPMLFALDWITGQAVIVELLEDQKGVVVRVPRQEDFGPVIPPRLDRRPKLEHGPALPLDAPESRR